MEVEIWKSIPGFDSVYEASSLGRVRSLDTTHLMTTRSGRVVQRFKVGRILKTHVSKQGYHNVRLYIEGTETNTSLARVILEAFVGPSPSEDSHADHKDGNRSNNTLKNLQWLSPEENRQKRKIAKGEHRPQAKLNESAALALKTGNLEPETAAQLFGVTTQYARKLSRGYKRWSHLEAQNPID